MHDTGVLRCSESAHLLRVCRMMLAEVTACATCTGCERGRGHGEGKNGSKCESYDSAHVRFLSDISRRRRESRLFLSGFISTYRARDRDPLNTPCEPQHDRDERHPSCACNTIVWFVAHRLYED